jgi:hypothetical protein
VSSEEFGREADGEVDEEAIWDTTGDASADTYRIDRLAYVVPRRVMTGKEIRNLPAPAVPDTDDLYLIHEDEDDVLVTDGMLIPYVVGRRFFTAPKIINAGRS